MTILKVDQDVVVSLGEGTSNVEHPAKERRVASKKGQEAFQSIKVREEEVNYDEFHLLFTYPSPCVAASGNKDDEIPIELVKRPTRAEGSTQD